MNRRNRVHPVDVFAVACVAFGVLGVAWLGAHRPEPIVPHPTPVVVSAEAVAP